jgi:hypothetical protein
VLPVLVMPGRTNGVYGAKALEGAEDMRKSYNFTAYRTHA